MLTRTLTVALLVAAPALAAAQAPRWEADPAHTHIGFTVRHLMLSNVKGEFTKYQVKVQGTPQEPTKAVIDVAVDTGSVTTGMTKRDEHLRSSDFFDAAKYPVMSFKSKKIVKAGQHGPKVIGDLTIRGVTREIVLEAKDVVGPVKDPWGVMRVGLQATGKIDRRQFGLTWNKALEAGGVLVGNDVAITLEVELMQAPETAKK